MNDKLSKDAALLIIDVQYAIDEPSWRTFGERNNPQAEDHMSSILCLWRQSDRKVIHIKHESREPNSTYRPGQMGAEFKKCVAPAHGETIIVKNVHSAFIGTNLESFLRDTGISQLVIFGVITNNSVESTVRMAANLGFTIYLVEDASFTFAKPDYTGKVHTAEEVHAMSLANMAGEYCTVINSSELASMM